jgi:nucleotide-binding universal stress UspA family protein
MSWARIMAPLSGGPGDAATIAATAMLAEPFGAEAAMVYAPVDVADVMPWTGEGFLGGVQTTALETLREAAAAGEGSAREAVAAQGYGKSRFIALQTPVWASLAVESRLSDVVVFTDEPARGKGPLAEYFRQMIADEQRPVLVARPGLSIGGVAVVAWDGSKEASRAARLAGPLLKRASRVVILAAPKATSRAFDPAQLQAYYAARGLYADVEVLDQTGEVAPALLATAERLGAEIMIAGAYGHTRLKEFILGGVTRVLLNAERPSLFLSH